MGIAVTVLVRHNSGGLVRHNFHGQDIMPMRGWACVGVSHQRPQILPYSITRQVAPQFSNWQPHKGSYARKVSSLPALCLMIGYWGRERS